MSVDITATPLPPRPPVATPAAWSFPLPQVHHLPGGLTAYLYDIPGQHVVSIRLAVPMSLRSEPERIEGVAWLLARLLTEGTVPHPGAEFTELLERQGIALGAGMSETALGVDMEVSANHLADALGLMTECVTQPELAAADVARIVRQRLAEIEQERASGAHRAALAFAATYYDPKDRASRPAQGSAESVARITREDVVAWHRDQVSLQGASIVIAGDLGEVDALDLLNETIGAVVSAGATSDDGEPTSARVAARRADDAARVVVVDRPGSVQSEIVIGSAGPDRTVQPSWAPFPVLAYLVGGSPGARIDEVLREEKGFTYGIRSTFRPRSVGGTFVTSGSVRSDVTGESVDLLLGILDAVADGVSEDELRTAVDFVSLTAPGRYETADAVADEAVTLVAEGRPLTFTSDTVAAVRELDRAAVETAWREHVGTERTVVIVGDAQSVLPQLAPLVAAGRIAEPTRQA